ncbi:DNA glycosylase AlkZ-like family protein [Halomonas urumqiensis]|nr:crosslink repair DNA glycosylase YcaQ family protein [Halomonas urumqiensis]GHE20859.1 hypothetical protein GCM10017767_13800 [Halomonas urumqiensis]
MTARQPFTLAAGDARRLLVRYHFQAAPLEAVIRRLGTIQFDPLAPVGTNPDLVLQARVPGYRQGDWRHAAYERRLLVDGWDKQASLIQPAEWWAQAPFQRWFARRWQKHGVDVDAPEARALVEQVARHGPATSLELGDQRADPALRGSWYGPKRSRHLLKALWDAGHLMTHHRVGGRHAYDLPERVLPQGMGKGEASATQDDALQRLVVRRVQAAGLLRPTADAAVWSLPCQRGERDRIAARAVAQGELVELDVEGTRYWATPAVLSRLDEAPAPTGIGGVRFLAPLDPLMWDRGGVARLFGFDYVWEVYKPQELRRWGYYVLPVMWGERFVARFDAKCRQGTLTLLAWHWEPDIHPARLPEGLAEALQRAASAFVDYLGASRVVLPRGLGREARRAWQRAVH